MSKNVRIDDESYAHIATQAAEQGRTIIEQIKFNTKVVKLLPTHLEFVKKFIEDAEKSHKVVSQVTCVTQQGTSPPTMAFNEDFQKTLSSQIEGVESKAEQCVNETLLTSEKNSGKVDTSTPKEINNLTGTGVSLLVTRSNNTSNPTEETTNNPPAEVGSALTREASIVYKYWCKIMNSKAQPPADINKRVDMYVKQYGLGSCLAMVKGCSLSSFHMGEDNVEDGQPKPKMYNNLTTIFGLDKDKYSMFFGFYEQNMNGKKWVLYNGRTFPIAEYMIQQDIEKHNPPTLTVMENYLFQDVIEGG